MNLYLVRLYLDFWTVTVGLIADEGHSLKAFISLKVHISMFHSSPQSEYLPVFPEQANPLINWSYSFYILNHVQVDENTASTLPSNFFVNNLLATMAITNDEPTVKKMLCDNCDSEDTVKNRCIECGMFLCQFCTESHKRSRSTKRHKILTIDGLKSESGPQKVAEKVRCSKHEDEVTKLFCKTCQTTICRDCIIVDHREHKYDVR